MARFIRAWAPTAGQSQQQYRLWYEVTGGTPLGKPGMLVSNLTMPRQFFRINRMSGKRAYVRRDCAAFLRPQGGQNPQLRSANAVLLLVIGHADKKNFWGAKFCFSFLCVLRRNDTCNIAKYAHVNGIVCILRYNNLLTTCTS